MSRLSSALLCFLAAFYLLFPFLDPMQRAQGTSVDMPTEYLNALQGLTGIGCLLILLSFVVVGAFGFALSRPLFRAMPEGAWLRAPAGFLIGYVASIPVFRVMSIVFPHATVSLVAFPVLSAMAAWLWRRESLEAAALPPLPWLGKAGLVLFFLFVPLLNLYIGTQYFFGDPQVYAPILSQYKQAPAGEHFPIILTHYDSTIFNYAILLWPSVQIDPAVLHWLTNSLCKIGAVAWIFLLFRRLGLARGPSAIAAAFFCFGSFGPNPLKHYLLFDSFNPLLRVLHPGRVVGVIVALVVFFFFWTGDAKRSGDGPVSWWLFFLLGLGLPAGPSHNFVFVAFFAAACLLVASVPAGSRAQALASRFFSPVSLGLLSVVTLLPFLNYSLREPVPGLWLFLSSILGGGLLVWLSFDYLRLVRLSLPSKKTPEGRLLRVYLAGVVVSGCLLGNLLSNNGVVKSVAQAARSVEWLPHLQVEDPFGKSMHAGDPLRGKWFVNAANGPEGQDVLKPWSEYDKGGRYFIAYFGLIYLAALAALYFLGRQLRAPPGREDAMALWLFLVVACLAMIPAFLFYEDFVSDRSLNWVKSRLLEAPIYFVMFSGLFWTLSKGARSWRVSAEIVSLVNSVGPAWNYGFLAQCLLNLQYLVALWQRA